MADIRIKLATELVNLAKSLTQSNDNIPVVPRPKRQILRKEAGKSLMAGFPRLEIGERLGEAIDSDRKEMRRLKERVKDLEDAWDNLEDLDELFRLGVISRREVSRLEEEQRLEEFEHLVNRGF